MLMMMMMMMMRMINDDDMRCDTELGALILQMRGGAKHSPP